MMLDDNPKRQNKEKTAIEVHVNIARARDARSAHQTLLAFGSTEARLLSNGIVRENADVCTLAQLNKFEPSRILTRPADKFFHATS
jgi:hypothetical protein